MISDNPAFEGVKLNDWSDDDLDRFRKEDDEADREEQRFNVHQVKAMYRGSYSLRTGPAPCGNCSG